MTPTKHRIGGYRIIAPVGAGGFATVYRALDERTGREVAIKVLAENHSLKSEMRRRFVEEIDLLSAIDSPSVAKVYRVGSTESGQPYMVLELADRGDLRRRLEEVRRSHQVLTRADLAMLASHLHEALGTLHEADIIHRDVSPANILIKARRANAPEMGVTLLEPGERFLLADLGYAKDMDRGSGLTAGGGTRGFAAPEQLDDVTVVDHRADVFSATAIMEWAAHDGDYAEDLEPFFDVGLAADPDDRFGSMDEWHEAFEDTLGSHLEDRTEPTNRGRNPVALAAAVICIGAAVATALALTTDPDGGSDVGAEAATPSTTAEEQVEATTTSVLEVDGSSTTEAAGSAPAGAPDALVQQPPEGALLSLDDDLVVSGRAMFAEGVQHVEVMVEQTEDDLYWLPEFDEFRSEETRFILRVSGNDPTDVTWEFTISAAELLPGNYRVQAWARGLDDEPDPNSDIRLFLIR